MLRRLDAELVHRKLARSRDHARELIEAGIVEVAGMAAQKPATQVRGDVSIRIKSEQPDHYVSRGAHKLVGALDRFSAAGLLVLVVMPWMLEHPPVASPKSCSSEEQQQSSLLTSVTECLLGPSAAMSVSMYMSA